MLEIGARVLSFPVGVLIIVLTLFSAIRTFVLPRSARDPLTRRIFLSSRKVFTWLTRKATTYEQRDAVWAMYAPITLLLMPVVWITLVMTGYALIYWSIGVPSLYDSFIISGSSILTLGFAPTTGLPATVFEFTEAMLGLILIALLIAYLPTMYSAFSQREAMVTLLEVRAGSPPFAIEMFKRFQRLHGMHQLHQVWEEWERWFVMVEETHTSLAALTFFRSPQSDRSWVTASGAILDAASLAASTLDLPRDAQADLCIRAGYIALRRICDFFRLEYNPHPQPGDPISITRDEFNEACDQLLAAGVPLKADRDQAWRDFAGWRVNYDVPLLRLASLTMAPYAPWSSDRSLRTFRSPRWTRRRKAETPQPELTP